MGEAPVLGNQGQGKGQDPNLDRCADSRVRRGKLALRDQQAGARAATAASRVHLGARAQRHHVRAAARTEHHEASDDHDAAHHDHDDGADEHHRHDISDVDAQRNTADTPDDDRTSAARMVTSLGGPAAASATAGCASSGAGDPRAVVHPHGHHGFPG